MNRKGSGFDFRFGAVSDITPPDVTAAVESTAVSIIRDEAEHEFESDGFDMVTCEDAAEAVAREGFRESFWYTSGGVVDDVREWYDDRITVDEPDVGLEPSPMVANRHLCEAPDGVVAPNEMLLIGDGAVTAPPFPVPGAPVVVRAPEGVAVVRL